MQHSHAWVQEAQTQFIPLTLDHNTGNVVQSDYLVFFLFLFFFYNTGQAALLCTAGENEEKKISFMHIMDVS